MGRWLFFFLHPDWQNTKNSSFCLLLFPFLFLPCLSRFCGCCLFFITTTVFALDSLLSSCCVASSNPLPSLKSPWTKRVCQTLFSLFFFSDFFFSSFQRTTEADRGPSFLQPQDPHHLQRKSLITPLILSLFQNPL